MWAPAARAVGQGVLRAGAASVQTMRSHATSTLATLRLSFSTKAINPSRPSRGKPKAPSEPRASRVDIRLADTVANLQQVQHW